MAILTEASFSPPTCLRHGKHMAIAWTEADHISGYITHNWECTDCEWEKQATQTRWGEGAEL